MSPAKAPKGIILFHGNIPQRKLLFLKQRNHISEEVRQNSSFDDEVVVFGNPVLVVWHDYSTDEVHFLRIVRYHEARLLGMLDEEMPNYAALAYPINPFHGIIFNGCRLFTEHSSENFHLGYVYADKVRTIHAAALQPLPHPNEESRAEETSFRALFQDAMVSNAAIRYHRLKRRRWPFQCCDLMRPWKCKVDQPYDWLDNMWPFASSESPNPSSYWRYLLPKTTKKWILNWIFCTQRSRPPTFEQDLVWVEDAALIFQRVYNGELQPRTPTIPPHSSRRRSSTSPRTERVYEWLGWGFDGPGYSSIRRIRAWPSLEWSYRRRDLILDEISKVSSLAKHTRDSRQELSLPTLSIERGASSSSSSAGKSSVWTHHRRTIRSASI